MMQRTLTVRVKRKREDPPVRELVLVQGRAAGAAGAAGAAAAAAAAVGRGGEGVRGEAEEGERELQGRQEDEGEREAIEAGEKRRLKRMKQTSAALLAERFSGMSMYHESASLVFRRVGHSDDDDAAAAASAAVASDATTTGTATATAEHMSTRRARRVKFRELARRRHDSGAATNAATALDAAGALGAAAQEQGGVPGVADVSGYVIELEQEDGDSARDMAVALGAPLPDDDARADGTRGGGDEDERNGSRRRRSPRKRVLNPLQRQLNAAMAEGNVRDIVDILVSTGGESEVNFRRVGGANETPLMSVCAQAQPGQPQAELALQAIPQLIRLGSVLDAEDANGRSAIEYAEQAGNDAAVRLIRGTWRQRRDKERRQIDAMSTAPGASDEGDYVYDTFTLHEVRTAGAGEAIESSITANSGVADASVAGKAAGAGAGAGAGVGENDDHRHVVHVDGLRVDPRTGMFELEFAHDSDWSDLAEDDEIDSNDERNPANDYGDEDSQEDDYDNEFQAGFDGEDDEDENGFGLRGLATRRSRDPFRGSDGEDDIEEDGVHGHGVDEDSDEDSLDEEAVLRRFERSRQRYERARRRERQAWLRDGTAEYSDLTGEYDLTHDVEDNGGADNVQCEYADENAATADNIFRNPQPSAASIKAVRLANQRLVGGPQPWQQSSGRPGEEARLLLDDSDGEEFEGPSAVTAQLNDVAYDPDWDDDVDHDDDQEALAR